MAESTVSRRAFLSRLVKPFSMAPWLLALLAIGPFIARWTSTVGLGQTRRFLRPPGAIEESDFLKACIRCGQCGQVCPNRCIQFMDAEMGLVNKDTPYIIPRQKACILCMKCTQICPTQALAPIAYQANAIIKSVNMGRARVDKNICLSFQGKTCGVCYRACPLADVAIKVGMLEQPEVLDPCVGCGLCERACIQIPQAIKIIPAYVEST